MNAVGLVVFVLWTGAALAGSAWLLERTLSGLHLPVRWAWVGALGLSTWLLLAAVATNVAWPGGPGAVGPAEVAAPVDGGGPAAAGSGDGVGGAAPTLDLLFGWWGEPAQLLASGAELLSAVEVDPRLVGGAWGGASLLAALTLGASLLRLRRRAQQWPEAMVLGRAVKVSPDTGPATIGILAPRIVIPRWARALDEQELELVLRHEAEHVRARDTLLLAFGLAAVVACPWSPLVWWKMRRLKAAVEVDCDARVLRHGAVPSRYGALLVALGTRGRVQAPAVPTIAGPASLLERRLTLMKRLQRGNSIPATLATTGLALVLLVVACSSDVPSASEARLETEAAASAGAEPAGREVVGVRVDRDGAVQVDGVDHPVERVSDVVAPLNREGVIASIEAHEAAPYRVVAAVQDELRAAGLLRVVFVVGADGQRSASRDASTVVEQGLAVVLPDTTMPDLGRIEAAQKNLLHLTVQQEGWVEARRSVSAQRDRIELAEVEEVVRRSLAANPSLIVLLRTRPDAEYRYMYDTLDAIRRANLTRFSIQLAE